MMEKVNWTAYGFDRFGYLNAMLEDTGDIENWHEKEAIRHSKRRKDSFKKGVRRQKMCGTWICKPRNTLRDGFCKGHFQFDTTGTDSKGLYGRHSNSHDKIAMSYAMRKALASAESRMMEDYEPECDDIADHAEHEAAEVWCDWTLLCRKIQSDTGFSDSEMEELSCTDILYLAAKYHLCGDNWKEPEPNGWEIHPKRYFCYKEPGSVDLGDGTVMVPRIKVSSACRMAEALMTDDTMFDCWCDDYWDGIL